MTPDRLMRLVVWLAVAMPCTDAGVVEAHKPVTSKYTYYEHIQPLFRFYCGGCHRPDGIAPMSLLSYETTYPWAESIKEHLLAPSLHPYHDDESYGVFRHDHRLTPRELDRIVDWADGGTPQGVAPADTLRIDTPVRWILGPPDRTLTLPEVVLGSEETEKTQTFVF
ncbi:MAG: hypothetical protein FJY97_15200, partial [candidate division Zixibacteria bacterium]|nr:hypothetical protein [candidate division Zixibacteria bacterium]